MIASSANKPLKRARRSVHSLGASCYGYPTKVSFDPHSATEDQSEYFETSAFKVTVDAAPDKSLGRARER